ncbi:DUF2273 domain-containing protein [Calditerricola satsumensis]|uniref:DUF2273 domain-containing protein n=1 Tax=Calditerricola satsumensis TaxID=373054 RepID=A0A8J3B7K2_9BACI|nr:hypothetical protein GCM10007043_14370 [Calditerricola satsumensis]
MGKMWLEWAWSRKGALFGTACGLVIGFVYLAVGWWDTLVFAAIVYLGYHIGKKHDNREDLRDVLARILPEKFMR